jgi:predicted O-methyltransferase YrrM
MKIQGHEIFGRITKKNIETLTKYAKQCKVKNPIFVDVGTLAGLSAVTVALANSDARVITIDPVRNDLLPINLKTLNLEKRVSYIEGTTKDLFTLEDQTIDMIFIDGIHDYKGVLNDLNNACKKLKKGAFILFHDYSLYDGIKKIVDQMEGVLYKRLEITPQDFPKDANIYVGIKL